MTFQVHTTDAATGQPVQGIRIQATNLETGQCWVRSSDGAGYSDLAILDKTGRTQPGDDLLIDIVKEGYANWSQPFTVTAADQQVAVALVPFA